MNNRQFILIVVLIAILFTLIGYYIGGIFMGGLAFIIVIGLFLLIGD